MMKKNQKVYKTLGNRLKVLRKNKYYTQSQLAELLHYDVKTISAMETGRRSITQQTAKNAAEIFHIDPTYLLDESITYKTMAEKFIGELKPMLDESAEENALMINAIIFLAALNGYSVDIQQIHGNGSVSVKDIFSKMKEYLIFSKNGNKEFTLSLDAANRLGNNLSDIFMSNIKWFINDK